MAAEASKSGTTASKNGKEINDIHQNAIWRQLITFEHDCARNYPQKWGFMMAPVSTFFFSHFKRRAEERTKTASIDAGKKIPIRIGAAVTSRYARG
jgi:hypothetical protein